MASKDDGRARPLTPSPLHDVITGGIEGASSGFAIDPLLHKIETGAYKNPLRPGWIKRTALYGGIGAVSTGLVGALVSATSRKAKQRKEQRLNDFEALEPAMIELDVDVPRAKRKYRPVVTGAGVAALAGGLSTLPAARKLIGIKARQVGAENLGVKSAAHNAGGKMVADYIEGAQKALNTGVKGKMIGHVIEHVLKNPEGKVANAFTAADYGSANLGKRLSSEHFARFRASPMSALHFWDYEHGLRVGNVIAKQDEAAAAQGRQISERLLNSRKRASDEMHYGREKAHAAIKEQIEVHGKNEMEAIKHVAYNHEDSQVQGYFNRLADTKSGAVDKYMKMSLVSPALIAGGTAGIVYGRKRNQTPGQAVKGAARVPLSALESLEPNMIELDSYDPMSDRSLKSGVRLDKYRKGIRAHEIDRHVHDYIRSAAIGATAGAVIPGGTSLRNRALIGAGGGTLVAGILHGAGHKDAYGEQSEDAKLVQKNVPKYAGAAAVVGGLVARFRKKKAVVSAASGSLKPSFWTGAKRITSAVGIIGMKPA